ncbi:Putative short-chain dehydrogenase/reductase SDR, NAD(P)-binding domain superfamily [Septoria linicola]|uniref:Short-chain dehydrogenase/reductase SDR, NAD(P)-binding domain superfamily n=1 Tax=Septoria linicola TaxID=215465 RepID=A0A9Q9AXQ3_9PEZI|nr:putative short-chain dehydrogenase/reductase SDR, NAD(P)-binding domain superfamily [Septoria linicola]USW52556.1 Putative short-chain dehydrogenase/reductase SDR, NAD(P)-binding domain superfamily [Septoria linicola]
MITKHAAIHISLATLKSIETSFLLILIIQVTTFQYAPPSNQTIRRDFTATTHATNYPLISPLALNLTGRFVLMTGAAQEDGKGYVTALAFARTGASGIVLADLYDISPPLVSKLKAAASEAKRGEPVVITGTVDISNLTSVEAFQEQGSAAFHDRLVVLDTNAAQQEPYRSILESDPEVYWRTWEVNVHGLFNMTRTFSPCSCPHAMTRGAWVNVSSSGALSVRAGSASYWTSKLAVLRCTEALNLEHSEQGLLAFCVNPGAIKPQMTVNEPEAIRVKLPHKPEIAGDTIVWLASQRREWLGGRYVSCPWYMEESMSRKEEISQGDKLKMKMACRVQMLAIGGAISGAL